MDQNGETVIGASVVVKGTTNGTITGLDNDITLLYVFFPELLQPVAVQCPVLPEKAAYHRDVYKRQGTTNPKGTREYQVEKPISITATPERGYEFTGWTIIGGDVTIENPGSSTTTATLHEMCIRDSL